MVVMDVNTLNYMGKLKSRYTKHGLLVGRANNFKKAIVTLKDGDKIDFYSNIRCFRIYGTWNAEGQEKHFCW